MNTIFSDLFMPTQAVAYITEHGFYLSLRISKDLKYIDYFNQLDDLLKALDKNSIQELILITNCIEEELSSTAISPIPETHLQSHLNMLHQQVFSQNETLHCFSVHQDIKTHGKLLNYRLLEQIKLLKEKRSVMRIDVISQLQLQLCLNQTLDVSSVNIFCAYNQHSGEMRLSIFKKSQFKYSQLLTYSKDNNLNDIAQSILSLVQYGYSEHFIDASDEIHCYIQQHLLNQFDFNTYFQQGLFSIQSHVLNDNQMISFLETCPRYFNVDLYNQHQIVLKAKNYERLIKYSAFASVMILILFMILHQFFNHSNDDINQELNSLNQEIKQKQSALPRLEIPINQIDKLNRESQVYQKDESRLHSKLLYSVSYAIQKIGQVIELNHLSWNPKPEHLILTFQLKQEHASLTDQLNHIKQIELEFNHQLNDYHIVAKLEALPNAMNSSSQKTSVSMNSHDQSIFKVKFAYENQ